MSSSGYQIRDKEGIHFVTFAVVDWVDVFTRKDYRDILLDSIRHCQKEKGLILHSWCLMSNHVHLVISAKEHNSSDILRDFKKYTSKQIIKAIKNIRRKAAKNGCCIYLRKLAKQTAVMAVINFGGRITSQKSYTASVLRAKN